MTAERPNRAGLIVRLTLPQIGALLSAADDHRQHLVDNGADTRALDNAMERLGAAWAAHR